MGHKWFVIIFWWSYVAMTACHTTLTPETYWKTMLPKTHMPKALKDILHSGGRSTLVEPAQVVASYGGAYFIFYNAAKKQPLDNSNGVLFFSQNDLKPATKMVVHLNKTTNQATFLPREIAKKIPFSTKKFPDILNSFSLTPNCLQAKMMKNTIKVCEELGIEGEKKYCATSLESMIDFSISELGKYINAISTKVEKNMQLQNYTITSVEKVATGSSVVCHKQNYVYAVFYCHKTSNAVVYNVFMVGADGTKGKVVAVCHMDTSAWNPKHLAFQILNVKPGTIPICHFLPGDNIVWVSS